MSKEDEPSQGLVLVLVLVVYVAVATFISFSAGLVSELWSN